MESYKLTISSYLIVGYHPFAVSYLVWQSHPIWLLVIIHLRSAILFDNLILFDCWLSSILRWAILLDILILFDLAKNYPYDTFLLIWRRTILMTFSSWFCGELSFDNLILFDYLVIIHFAVSYPSWHFHPIWFGEELSLWHFPVDLVKNYPYDTFFLILRWAIFWQSHPIDWNYSFLYLLCQQFFVYFWAFISVNVSFNSST